MSKNKFQQLLNQLRNTLGFCFIMITVTFLSCGGGDDSPSPYDDNNVPVASAGQDQVATFGAVVTLDGSASSDADGDYLTYSWSQISGEAVTPSMDRSGTGKGPFPGPSGKDLLAGVRRTGGDGRPLQLARSTGNS